MKKNGFQGGLKSFEEGYHKKREIIAGNGSWTLLFLKRNIHKTHTGDVGDIYRGVYRILHQLYRRGYA